MWEVRAAARPRLLNVCSDFFRVTPSFTDLTKAFPGSSLKTKRRKVRIIYGSLCVKLDRDGTREVPFSVKVGGHVICFPSSDWILCVRAHSRSFYTQSRFVVFLVYIRVLYKPC